jgi:hypothetical protein
MDSCVAGIAVFRSTRSLDLDPTPSSRQRRKDRAGRIGVAVSDAASYHEQRRCKDKLERALIAK